MDTDEQRPTSTTKAAKPRSLLLRSAKVVCFSGEYICLVRDVSAEGTLLSFLHDTPPDARMMLVLANGLTYPIERLWEGRSQAGYRFASDVSMAEFMNDSAPYEVRPIRLAIEAPARLVDGSKTHVARLLDLSSTGAKFECDAAVPSGRLVSFQIGGMAQFLGEVMWSADSAHTSEQGQAPAGAHGFRLSHPLPLRELAAEALRLQPFAPRERIGFGTALHGVSAA